MNKDSCRKTVISHQSMNRTKTKNQQSSFGMLKPNLVEKIRNYKKTKKAFDSSDSYPQRLSALNTALPKDDLAYNSAQIL